MSALTYCFPNRYFLLHGEFHCPAAWQNTINPDSVLVAAADKESGERSGAENIKGREA